MNEEIKTLIKYRLEQAEESLEEKVEELSSQAKLFLEKN